MRPYGCFGSSLACDAQSQTCIACPKLDECSDIVNARRPAILKLLSKFSDADGNPVSLHWMTPKEKRELTAKKRSAAHDQCKIQIYGTVDRADKLRDGLHTRARPIFDRMTKANLNILTDKLDTLAAFDRQMGLIIKHLKAQPATLAELTAALAQKLSISEATAKSDAQSRTSILLVADRAQRVGKTLELK